MLSSQVSMACAVLVGSASLAFGADIATNALPTNGQVVAGQAVMSQTGGAAPVLTVNQSSQRAVINWDSFNVGSKATVNFNTPGANSTTLNRVTGATASMINGAVNSNGNVIFVNANGVTFGKGAQVNAPGVVATTMDIANKTFMESNGSLTFSGNGTGAVVNQGRINVANYVALLAPEVRNEGYLIASKGGAVALGAGQKITLNFSASQLLSMTVDVGVYNALIANAHVIEAQGGIVILAASAANQLSASVIKNTGSISASSMSSQGGIVELVANTITQAGTIAANSTGTASTGTSSTGGQINLVGSNITLAATSSTSATGTAGGGQVNIGLANTALTGGSQVNSTNPSALSNAQAQSLVASQAASAYSTGVMASTVSVEAGAVVDASSTASGNGGIIAIWSQVKTVIAGTLNAMAGSLLGNGGFIETSSKGNVSIASTALINTSAANGKAGTWLLDPIDLTIDTAAAAVISSALNTSNVILDVTGSSSAWGNSTTSTTSTTGVLTLAAGADIFSSNTATSLTLWAEGGTININNHITAGNVYAVAQTINVNGSVNTNGSSNNSSGNIYLAGTIINILGSIGSNGSTNSGNSTNTSSSNSSTTYNTKRRESFNASDVTHAVNGGLTLDTNTYTSAGGVINIIASGDITIGSHATITANGTSGGTISIISTAGKVSSSGVVDALGLSGTGGTIVLAGQVATTLTGSLISGDGLLAGGSVQIGVANAIGSGSTLAPPAMRTFVNSLISLNSNSTISSDSSSNSSDPSYTVITSILSRNTSLDSSSFVFASGAASAASTVSSTTASTISSTGGTITIAGNLSLSSAGVIVANGDHGGLIILSSPAGTYQNTGYVQTNGGAGLGGTIAQSGLISTSLIGANISANGTLGGGNIITGRNFKLNPLSDSATQAALLPSLNNLVALPTSALTTIDQNTTLTANALTSGNGGNILNWGDEASYAGTYQAKGAGSTGNGGLIETSANHLSIADGIAINASTASNSVGTKGQWLLDPYDLTIASSGGDISGATIGAALANADVTLTTSASSITCTNVTCSGSGTSTGNGDIYVGDAITWFANTTLTLSAYRNIYVNSAITSTGASGALVLNSGQTSTTGSISGAGNIAVTGTKTFNVGGSSATGTLSGLISGAGAVTKSGAGTLTLSGANTYTGATTISAGTLAITNAAGLGTTASGTTISSAAVLDLQNVTVGAEAITLNGGTLATSTGTSSLSGAVSLGADSTINVTGTSLTISGAISSSGSLTKTGTGTLTLSGTNTYTGGTTISAGTLALGVSNVMPDSGVVTINGGTFAMGTFN
ncbi:S-layer family protein, partial [Polynucleobacter sp. Fuers-14]|uniref:beta strand repeat-containing protein n=1 Tax=Polynucleobacter sp. Fuers-14 TaxID=1758364 RepID=UPI001C0D4AF5